MGLDINEYINERDAALLSFDRQKIEEYMRKYHLDISEQESVFWSNIARAILTMKNAPESAKTKAREILTKYRRSERAGRDMNCMELW